MPRVAPWRARSLRQKSEPRGSRQLSEPRWRELLGRKVSLRYALHDDPDHPFSEAIGVVMSVRGDAADELVTIVNRRGETVEIAASDVLAHKVFEL